MLITEGINKNISIHVPRVEDDVLILPLKYDNVISIHVPRVEDDTQESKKKRKIDISIHVPRVEDDVNNYFIADVREGFQSTSPVWRTTSSVEFTILLFDISIHVPRVEDDFRCSFLWSIFI